MPCNLNINLTKGMIKLSCFDRVDSHFEPNMTVLRKSLIAKKNGLRVGQSRRPPWIKASPGAFMPPVVSLIAAFLA
ncbi:hypothetical protein Ae201684P_005510 [Aphanomyces euteiches]|uniref:Uncharacterized protein n=1 Tax=Aphanomyces euteiches TaxID=100861 RepID=A0A6G0X4U7_9STRA|nr:hypothetical protein Ae201684_008530 [Aphanomyces euteiches]KAH9085810.1 hypothetical protein Ae201684P_005510 [Aphanomyces euteiches]